MDLSDLDQRRRLMAYIWADQPERMARARAAIEVALESGTSIESADAVDWTWTLVAPRSGAVTVLYHSVFWQYMVPERQAALEAVVREIGSSATPAAPFAWLRMEPPAMAQLMDVTLTLWPRGEDRVLAVANPHAASDHWLAR